jgi:hypothetical protein
MEKKEMRGKERNNWTYPLLLPFPVRGMGLVINTRIVDSTKNIFFLTRMYTFAIFLVRI